MPWSARIPTSTPNDGANGASRPRTADSASAAVMTRARPHDSAMADSGTTASASVPVVADSTRLDADDDTPNSTASVGSRPCTL
jgi:hypothetical protein